MTDPIQLKQTTPVMIYVPTCSFEHFAHVNNVTLEVVRKWADREYVPTVKVGKRRLINLAKFTKQIL